MKHRVLKHCSHVGCCREHFVEFGSTLIKTVFGEEYTFWVFLLLFLVMGCFIAAVRVNLINLKCRIYYLHSISPKSKSPFSVSWQPVLVCTDNQQERAAHALFISPCILPLCTTPLFTFAFFFASHSHLFNLNPLPSYAIFFPPSTNLLFPYFCASEARGVF